jgi:site-specific DNA recombinase
MSETLHIYTRVSTSAQEDAGTSLESQKDLGIKKSKELGFEYRLWNEGGQSSSREDLENRPALVELLSEVESGNVKHLFVFNPDRLSRNDVTWNVIRLKLVKNDVTLHTSAGVYPLSDPMNKLLLGIMSEISSYDNQIRAERSRLGKLEKVRKGFWLGGPPPFGYSIDKKRLVENKAESKWIRFIFQSYLNGRTIREIKQELLSNGVMTRRNKPVWSLGSIEKVLGNTHYSGYYRFKDGKSGDQVRVECPSIMPVSLFRDVQKMREGRTRQTRIKESNQKHFYLLRDFLVCGHCGARYSGRLYKAQYRSVYYCPRLERNYVNEGTGRVEKCSNRRYLKIDETDQLVWDTVLEVLSHSNLFKEEVKKQVLGESITHKDHAEEIKKLKRKLKVVEKDVADITNSIVNLETDKILKRRDRHELDRILRNVEDARIDLEAQREQLKVQLHGLESQNRWTDWLSKFGDRLGAMVDFTPQERHEFLKGVIDHIVVKTLDKQSHELVIRFKIPYVNDSLVWRDANRKSLGYDLKDGDFGIGVDIDTKKKIPEIPIKPMA